MKKNYDVGKSDSGVEVGDFVLVRDEVIALNPYTKALSASSRGRVRMSRSGSIVENMFRLWGIMPEHVVQTLIRILSLA